MKKKHAKTINDFEQKNQMNQQKNLYHRKNSNKHYLYATINLEDSIETNNNENIKENYIFRTNGNIYIKSKINLKNQNVQTPTLYNKRPISSRHKNEKKIFALKNMNIFSKASNHKNNYFRKQNENEVIMREEENKKVIKEEEKKDKDNDCERPEDISDYINIDNIDEEDYNNYKTLNGKIENEAIEEVEESKETSELRQSSEFYNNSDISGSKSNLKKNMKDIWTKKNIYQKKGSNKKIEDNNSLFSKYLTFNKKVIYNKSNKIISKIGYKKCKKIFKISINSNITINSNDHKNTMNFEIQDYFYNKSDRNNLIFKKNYYIIKEADNKNRTSNNSIKKYNIMSL